MAGARALRSSALGLGATARKNLDARPANLTAQSHSWFLAI
jgi:hypothetical protein